MSNFCTLNAFPLLSQYLTSFILLKQPFVKHLKGVVSEYKDLIEHLHDPQIGYKNMTLPFPEGLGMSIYTRRKVCFGGNHRMTMHPKLEMK